MDAISPLSGLPASNPVHNATTPKSGKSTFGNILKNQLREVNQEHQSADQAIQDLATGSTNNVHETVMSVVQADLSLRMIIEVRNRLIESYQEIMRMQI